MAEQPDSATQVRTQLHAIAQLLRKAHRLEPTARPPSPIWWMS